MRCSPLRWLLGVVLVLGLLGIMNLQGVLAQIEGELKAQAQSALEQAGLGWAQVDFSGRDGEISGRASDEREQRQANEITQTIWGVRTIKNRTELVEEQKNFVWRAMLRDDKLRLTGFVPNETTRKAIIGAAKATFPQLEIDDRMKLARGVAETESWLGAISFSLKQLSGLKAGARVELESDGLAIAGEAEDIAAFRSIKAALANSLPQGVTLKGDGVIAPAVKPYVWAARLSGTQLQLGGYVPNERAREEIFAAAQKVFAQRVIVDRMRIASGEPSDLIAAAVGALGKLAQLEEGAIELKQDQLVLSGTATREATAEALRSSLSEGMPASIRVTEEIKFREPTIKPVVPYRTAVAIEGDTVVLTGYAPGEPQRTALADAVKARFSKHNVGDRLQLGAGAPEGWQACMTAGLAGLAKLGGGRMVLEDRALKFAGVTEDEQLAEAVHSELRAATNRACELGFNIVVDVPPEPELSWRAIAADGQIRLEGEVMDAATKAELIQAATKLFPTAKVVDQMEVKQATSKKWPKVTDTGLKLLARLRTGEARLNGVELTVSGQAPDTAVANLVRQHLKDLPKGYKGGDAIEIRSDAMIWAEQEAKRKAEADARRKAEEEEARRQAAEEERRKREEALRQKADEETAQRKAQAAADAQREAEAKARAAEVTRQAALAREQQSQADALCQQAMDGMKQQGTINFERASYILREDSRGVLSRLRDVAASCPQAEIEIHGHTDAEGTPERNQVLSERRAQEAVDFLVENGIPINRIRAIGHGATRPIEPNDTPESRAVNRRIEIIIKHR